MLTKLGLAELAVGFVESDLILSFCAVLVLVIFPCVVFIVLNEDIGE